MHMRAGFLGGPGLLSSILHGSVLYSFLINKKTIKSVFLKSVESKLWEVRIFVWFTSICIYKHGTEWALSNKTCEQKKMMELLVILFQILK